MKSIRFTAAYDEKTQKKVLVYSQLNTMLQNIEFNEYSNNFNQLGVVFQCLEPFQTIETKEYKIQRRKTKTLELYLILDYERIMQGTDPENLQHIKEVFLKGCETFLKPLKDFKWKEFNYEVQKIIHR